jgi:hypothetical protein
MFPIIIFVTPVATVLKLQAANMGVTLYGNPKSTCTALAHVVIAGEGINYNFVFINRIWGRESDRLAHITIEFPLV